MTNRSEIYYNAELADSIKCGVSVITCFTKPALNIQGAGGNYLWANVYNHKYYL